MEHPNPTIEQLNEARKQQRHLEKRYDKSQHAISNLQESLSPNAQDELKAYTNTHKDSSTEELLNISGISAQDRATLHELASAVEVSEKVTSHLKNQETQTQTAAEFQIQHIIESVQKNIDIQELVLKLSDPEKEYEIKHLLRHMETPQDTPWIKRLKDTKKVEASLKRMNVLNQQTNPEVELVDSTAIKDEVHKLAQKIITLKQNLEIWRPTVDKLPDEFIQLIHLDSILTPHAFSHINQNAMQTIEKLRIRAEIRFTELSQRPIGTETTHVEILPTVPQEVKTAAEFALRRIPQAIKNHVNQIVFTGKKHTDLEESQRLLDDGTIQKSKKIFHSYGGAISGSDSNGNLLGIKIFIYSETDTDGIEGVQDTTVHEFGHVFHMTLDAEEMKTLTNVTKSGVATIHAELAKQSYRDDKTEKAAELFRLAILHPTILKITSEIQYNFAKSAILRRCTTTEQGEFEEIFKQTEEQANKLTDAEKRGLLTKFITKENHD